MFAELATFALVIEAAFGYPPALSSRIGHPVIWIGSAISRCDAALNLSTAPNGIRRLAGIASVMLLISGALLIGFALHEGAAFIPEPMSIVILAVLSSSLIAQRSLYEHVAAVATALETGGLVAGREAVGGTHPYSTAGCCGTAVVRLFCDRGA